MHDRTQEFKKWLIDEMKTRSNLSYKNIYFAVDAYSKTSEFIEKYRKYCALMPKTQKKEKGPIPIKKILENIFIKKYYSKQ